MADLGIRYANALFDISIESGKLSEYYEQARLLRDVLKSEGAMGILAHPLINANEKRQFLDNVFNEENKIEPPILAFMKLTVAKNRENYIIPAFDKLVEMIRVKQNKSTARVVTAVPLSEAQKTQLATTLSAKLNKAVDINVVIDPRVVAGISIQVDGFMLDRTVKNLLKDLRETVRKGADE